MKTIKRREEELLRQQMELLSEESKDVLPDNDQQLLQLFQRFYDLNGELTALDDVFFKLSEESKATDRINRQARYLSMAAIVISVIGFMIKILAAI